jgi:hypothetical protein
MSNTQIRRMGQGVSPGLLALPTLAVALVALCCPQPASAASPGGLVVIPHPVSQSGLSYFKLSPRPGTTAQAGTIELRNPTATALRVVLVPVDGETLSTLGSSYAPPGSRPHGSTLWLHLATRNVTLAPGASSLVPVSVSVPAGAHAGEYLSGVSIEALDQGARDVKKKGVSIASVSRYAIGTEVSLTGPRRSLIQFTGATVRREPAGMSFTLKARNTGNTILQGVYGRVRITRAGQLVTRQPLGRGTFVAHTRIAYPVNAFRQTAPEGTRYHITAWMRYRGGIARLDTTVSFGHRAAVAQEQYGGPPATAPGTAWWKIAAAIAAVLYAMFTTFLLLRRRRRSDAT